MANRCGPEGYSFLFETDEGSVCVEAPSLAAVETNHPDLVGKLAEVWCHGCANRLWGDECGQWQDDWIAAGAPEIVVRHPPVRGEEAINGGR
jgi:hypothetical protein